MTGGALEALGTSGYEQLTVRQESVAAAEHIGLGRASIFSSDIDAQSKSSQWLMSCGRCAF